MARKNAKWTPAMNEFLKAECPCNDKHALLALLNAFFGTDFTFNAMSTHMCEQRIHAGIKPWQNDTGIFRGKQPRPVMSEQEKKGYIWVKVAMPNVWMPKHVYVWEQTYGEKVDRQNEHVMFLDGNNRNFDPANLMKVPLKIVGIVSGLIEKDDTAEIRKQKIELAMLKHEMLNLAEKAGLVTKPKGYSYRVLKSVAAKRQRERIARMSPEEYKEHVKKTAESQKKRMQWLKENDPEEYERRRKMHNEACLRYLKRKRAEGK